MSSSIKRRIDAGGRLLAMASGSIATFGKELSSFSTNLRQHLTELSLLRLHGEKGKAQQHLEALGMLTALQKLGVGWYTPHYDLAGQKFVLKLPHLVSLEMSGIEQRVIVLSCSRLADVFFESTMSVQIEVEGASVDTLTLNWCKDLRPVLHSHEAQLQKLEYLRVVDCSEIGKRLIDDVGQMRQLWYLEYIDLPATCMPASFPKGLQHLEVLPLTWAYDFPSGIKGLHGLRHLSFYPLYGSWEI